MSLGEAEETVATKVCEKTKKKKLLNHTYIYENVQCTCILVNCRILIIVNKYKCKVSVHSYS